MGSRIVQFRVGEEEIAWLNAHGYNPNEFAREGMLRYLRRKRAEAAQQDVLSGIEVPLSPVEQLMRAIRDDHPQVE